MPPSFDFANILFAGPCNRFCPFCIGKILPDRVNASNLDVYPPLGIDAFIAKVNRYAVNEIVFTGTVTDPQLYRHEAKLLSFLRGRLHRGARFSVHTNGVLALRKLDVFNSYDRACVSLPSFKPATYEKMMGSRRIPDLKAILERALIPVKVSCVVNEHNAAEMPAFLERCRSLGVRRLVLRGLYGEKRPETLLKTLTPKLWFRGNPVYTWEGMEIAVWDFDQTRMTSLNLFADGTLGTSYLLDKTSELEALHG